MLIETENITSIIPELKKTHAASVSMRKATAAAKSLFLNDLAKRLLENIDYILAENQVKPMDDIYKNPMESSISHKGTSNGTRTIITIGEVKGIMEHQKANGPSGFSML